MNLKSTQAGSEHDTGKAGGRHEKILDLSIYAEGENIKIIECYFIMKILLLLLLHKQCYLAPKERAG